MDFLSYLLWIHARLCSWTSLSLLECVQQQKGQKVQLHKGTIDFLWNPHFSVGTGLRQKLATNEMCWQFTRGQNAWTTTALRIKTQRVHNYHRSISYIRSFLQLVNFNEWRLWILGVQPFIRLLLTTWFHEFHVPTSDFFWTDEHDSVSLDHTFRIGHSWNCMVSEQLKSEQGFSLKLPYFLK